MTPSLKLMDNLYICDLSDEAFLYAFHFCVFLFLSVAVNPCVERMPIKRKTGLSNVSEANKKMVKTILKIKKNTIYVKKINKHFEYKLSKDFTKNKRKTYWVVILSHRFLPKILSMPIKQLWMKN